MALPHGDIVESHPFPTDLAFPTIQVIVQMMWRCALGLYDGCHRIMSSRVRLSDPLPRVVALMWQIQTHDTQPKINNKKANQCPQKCGYYYAGLAKKQPPEKNILQSPQVAAPQRYPGCRKFEGCFLVSHFFQPSIMTPTKKKVVFFILWLYYRTGHQGSGGKKKNLQEYAVIPR